MLKVYNSEKKVYKELLEVYEWLKAFQITFFYSCECVRSLQREIVVVRFQNDADISA